MKETEKLRQRFCKDAGIPVRIFKDPYFTERMALMNHYFQCREQYEKFIKNASEIGESQYLDLYDNVINCAIEDIKKNEAFQYFNTQESMQKFAKFYKVPTKNIFADTNIGKYFLSFDMKQGNFTALRHYNPAIVGNAETYEDMMRKYTDDEHIISSKYVRQRLFGNLNPKRQTTYEAYLMEKVMSVVMNIFGFQMEQFRSCSSDEIIIEVKQDDIDEEFTDKIETVVDICNKRGIRIRGEVYTLIGIHEIQDETHEAAVGYIKRFVYGDKEIDIKGLDPVVYPYALRKLYSMTVKESDAVFMADARIAKLIKPIDIVFRDYIPHNEE